MYNNLDNEAYLVYCFENNSEFLFLRFLPLQVQLPWNIFVADTDGAESYISCGGDYFGSMTEIGFPDYQAYLTINGNAGGGTPCPADFNGDGVVNGADFGSILAAWGPCAGCPEDLNGDGVVNGADVGGLLAAWGACP